MLEKESRKAVREGFNKRSLAVSIPIIIGYIPVGIASGVLLNSAGLTAFEAMLMSSLVLAGGAQFIAASMIAASASISSIIITTFIVNLRHTLMSTALSQYIKNEPKGFLLLFSHGITDETFAININEFSKGDWSARDAAFINIIAWSLWVLSNGIGGYAGEVIPINDSVVNFVLISMFIFLLVMQVKNKIFVFTAIVCVALSVIFYYYFQNSLYIILATIIASFIGFKIEKYLAKEEM
ncbi:MAG: AzlC family ABC transporter permease [Clostridium sp.]